MGIDKQSDIAANLQIGPTTLGMVRIYVEADGVDLPLDFEPEEAEEPFPVECRDEVNDEPSRQIMRHNLPKRQLVLTKLILVPANRGGVGPQKKEKRIKTRIFTHPIMNDRQISI